MAFSETRCPGQPTTAVTQALLRRADELIRNDQQIPTSKLVPVLSVSKGSVNNTTDALGYSQVCYCWVPYSLTDHQKTVRQMCAQICTPIIKHIVKAFYHGSFTSNCKQKRQSVEHHHSAFPQKFKPTSSSGKNHGHCSGMQKGSFIETMPLGQNINSDLYSKTIKNHAEPFPKENHVRPTSDSSTHVSTYLQSIQ